MSRLMSESEARRADAEWRERWALAQHHGGRHSRGWLLTGLAVAGLGFLAWKYVGPDLRRYMKIRDM